MQLHILTGDIKASLIENLNKTLNMRISKFMDHRNTYSYVNDLQRIVANINSTYNRGIGMKPADVTSENANELFTRVYLPKLYKFLEPSKTTMYPINTKVRIARKRNYMTNRSYDLRWNHAILYVHKHLRTSPPRYILRDYYKNILPKKYYHW